MKIFYQFFLLFSLLNISCGVYSFRGNNPPEGIKTIAVPLFNDISGFAEARLKENFTDKLKSIIISDNTFLITDKSKADGVLNCTVVSVKDDPLVISGNDNVTKRKITISVRVDFQNMKKQKQIWERTYENWGEYDSSNNTFSARETGVTTSLDKICEDILNDITSNW
ncbi:MAG TPA: LPS assembly lipoprotein LptE [Ignavibacteria bacterium]